MARIDGPKGFKKPDSALMGGGQLPVDTVPQREQRCTARMREMDRRPPEGLEEPLRGRINALRQLDGQVRNGTSRKVGIAQGFQKPDQAAGRLWLCVDQDINVHLIPC